MTSKMDFEKTIENVLEQIATIRSETYKVYYSIVGSYFGIIMVALGWILGIWEMCKSLILCCYF